MIEEINEEKETSIINVDSTDDLPIRNKWYNIKNNFFEKIVDFLFYLILASIITMLMYRVVSSYYEPRIEMFDGEKTILQDK